MKTLLYVLLAGIFTVSTSVHASYYTNNEGELIKDLKAEGVKGLDKKSTAEVYKKFKEYAKGKAILSDLVKKITPDTILPFCYERKGTRIYFLYAQEGMFVYLRSIEGKSTSTSKYEVKRIYYTLSPKYVLNSVPTSLAGINAQTKLPFFTLPEKELSQLKDPDFFKTLARVLNQNFQAAMMIIQIPEKEVKKETNRGKAFNHPYIYDPASFKYISEKIPPQDLKAHQYFGYYVGGAIELTDNKNLKLVLPTLDTVSSMLASKDYKLQPYDKKVVKRSSYSAAVYFAGVDLLHNTKINMKSTSVSTQLKNSKSYLSVIDKGLTTLMSEYNLVPFAAVDGNKLNAEQRILWGWYNAFNRYLLFLTATGFHELINWKDELGEIKDLSYYIGPEITSPITDIEREKAEKISDKYKLKREREEKKAELKRKKIRFSPSC